MGRNALPRQWARRLRGPGYFPGTDGMSMIQGHAASVFTLPSLFLTTVIFMTLSPHTLYVSARRACLLLLACRRNVHDPGTRRHCLHFAARLLDDRDLHDSKTP